ncbi:MAG: SOUL family heme-binding protein [Novipirellula sp. JB048]
MPFSGANEDDQKISMTTPVFMEGDGGQSDGSMGFVMPTEVATEGAPQPKGEGVEIRKRKGGRFAVIRFPGKLDSELVKNQAAKLREWMAARGLEGEKAVETAGYDPPFTPAPLRRNEVLIRLKPSDPDSPVQDSQQ